MIEPIRRKLKDTSLRFHAFTVAHPKVVNRAHWTLHVVYAGGTFLEGHGIHAWAAGALFIFLMVHPHSVSLPNDKTPSPDEDMS